MFCKFIDLVFEVFSKNLIAVRICNISEWVIAFKMTSIITGWHIRLFPRFCWHQSKSSVLIYRVYTKTQPWFWCQQNLENNLTCHPVPHCIESTVTRPCAPTNQNCREDIHVISSNNFTILNQFISWIVVYILENNVNRNIRETYWCQ